jgi:ribose 5-phosphate isomerase B
MNKLVTESDVKKLLKSGANEIVVPKGTVLTPLALDRIRHSGLKVVSVNAGTQSSQRIFRRIVIGSDHTGMKTKKMLADHLKKDSYEILDIGTFTEESVDYPDFAYEVARRVKTGEADCGIILDATGIPSAITANKLPGIRAATCYNEFSTKSSREHNNANILVLGAKTLGEETIKSITDIWLNTKYLGDRHQRRLDKIDAIEKKLMK